MVTPLRQQFLLLTIGWLLAVVAVTFAFGIASLELIYILSLVGFQAIVRLVSSVNVRPDWRVQLRWLVIASLAGLPVIILSRTAEVLPQPVVEEFTGIISRLIGTI